MELYWKQIMSLSEVVSIGSGKEGLISLSHPLAPWTRSSVPMILKMFQIRWNIFIMSSFHLNLVSEAASGSLGTWNLNSISASVSSSLLKYDKMCWKILKIFQCNVMENIFSVGKYTWKDTPPRSPRWSTCSRRCPCRGRRAETPSSGAPPTGPPWTQWTGGHVYARVWNED